MVWLLAILAYLLGSLSFAVLLSRWFGTQDPRASGSGNPGATNMLRVAGKKLAILTLSILAREFGLMVTAGSDFHAPGDWSELGMYRAVPEDLPAMWPRFARHFRDTERHSEAKGAE